MNDLVSVVIPCYNRKETIMDSLKSVLNQTYKNIEVIVVDDASTDRTYELFEQIVDSRVKYYRYEQNQGACYARNYGVEFATGDYIAFQDSDDIWHLDKLEKQLEDLVNYRVEMVYCGMNRIDNQNRQIVYYPRNDFISNESILEQLLASNMISTQTILLKREVMEKIKFDVTFHRYQDWDFSLQAALHGIKMMYRKEALVDSEIQENSISATVNAGKAYEHLYEKYQEIYMEHPKAEALFLAKVAMAYRKEDPERSKAYLIRSLRNRFCIKSVLRLAMLYMNMWN